jgi:ferric-dicitrate binding protein FerR (iron transport regulator)
MSERDDYLLDPSQPRDPEIEALEQALAPLQWREQPLRERPPAVPPAVPPRARRWPWLALAAAVLLAGLGFWWTRGAEELRELRPGAGKRTFTSAKGASTIRLGDLVEITLKPGSELAFLHWQKDQALFALARGGLSARVAAPPAVQKGFFVVDTPLGRVIDQGCRYELDLDRDGSARVRVTEGMVSFRFREREVFVPMGASTVVDANGPHTPCFDDAPAELAKAVREYDMLVAKQAQLKGIDVGQRVEGAKQLLGSVRRERDTLVIWHLLLDDEPAVRDMAERRLLELTEPPVAAKGNTFDAATWLPALRLRYWQPAK